MSIVARFKVAFSGFDLDVDLTLPGRGVTALFGHSGSGKTTLLRCLAGLERAPEGHLSVGGEHWQRGRAFMPTHRRPLGYVFQEASLFPHLDVRRNLEYGMRRIAEGARRVSLDSAIELLGLSQLLTRMPVRLSGGERQRVAIARALAVSPKVLFMDEPLAALDLARKQEILPYLDRLHDELEMPVIYVTHSPDEVARLADHLVVMDRGRAVAAGPLVDTLARVDLPVRLGEEEGVVLHGVVADWDETWHQARIEFPGGSLWLCDHGASLGRRVRVRVLARDVSLGLERAENTSIQNLLPATVEAIGGDGHPALALVRIRVGESAVLARLTRRSATAMGLAPQRAVLAQVKTATLMD